MAGPAAGLVAVENDPIADMLETKIARDCVVRQSKLRGQNLFYDGCKDPCDSARSSAGPFRRHKLSAELISPT
jgi:hypothetical protein